MAAKLQLILACALIVSGCAGSSPAVDSASPQSLDVKPAVPQRPRNDSKYSVKEKDGVKLYCKEETAVGSHARVAKQCLTEAEWREVQDETRRVLRRPVMPRPSN
jgi:hypothetical protein